MLLHLPQLIYTNVEANDSPARRRGFQIWLASPELAEPVREAIAARLGDFALPHGVRPDSREGRGLRRHQFFRVRHEAIWVLAQTAPLADTDMFGRGGRFYTHALVLPEEEFEKVGFDPIAILNGGARFQAQIAEGKQEPDWKLGRITPAELTLSQAPPSALQLAPEMIAALAAILQQAEAPPVVMAEPPTALLAVLAALFPWLPPRLRRRAAFDTLAPSPAAAGLSRFAGVYSPAAFKLWRQPPPRLDAAGSVLTPALKADTFFRRLMTTWAACPAPPGDELLQAACDLLTAMQRHNLRHCVPAGLDEAQLAELFEVAGLGERLTALQSRRMAEDLGSLADDYFPALLQPALVDYFRADSRAQQLERVSEPIPPEQLAQWLDDILAADDGPALSIEQARRLEEWLGEQSGPDFDACRLIAIRWRSKFPQLRELLAGMPEETADRMRNWCLQTLRRRCRGEGELPRRLAARLKLTGDEAQDDAECYLAATADDTPEATLLQFLLAYQRGNGAQLQALLASAPTIHEEARTQLGAATAEYGCRDIDGHLSLGIAVTFLGPQMSKRLVLAHAWIRHDPGAMFDHWSALANQRPESPRERATAPPPLLAELVATAKWDELSQALQRVSDDDYRRFVSDVLARPVTKPEFRVTGTDSFWLGLALNWPDNENQSKHQTLFASITARAGSGRLRWLFDWLAGDLDRIDSP